MLTRFVAAKEKLFLLMLGLVSVCTRLIQLGYSDLYGDETKTIFLVKNVSLWNFLINQRKGPVQFLVVWAIEKLTGSHGEFFIRLPFAVSGVLSVFILYFLVKKIFNSSTAFLAGLLFATNGLFIAFSRTAQYQSLLILFGLTGILLLIHAKDEQKIQKQQLLYFYSGIITAIGVLTHYDFVFYIIPMIFVILISRNRNNLKTCLRNFFIFTIPILLALSIFYLPYVSKGYFKNETSGYLAKRIAGKTYAPNNSLYTLKVYNPYLVNLIPLLFFAFGFIGTPNYKKLLLFIWFIVPFVTFEFIFLNPGTHIYNYLIPLIILSSYGIDNILNLLTRKSKLFFSYIVYGIILLGLLINTKIYIPFINTGYPWSKGNINRSYHLYLYGFPYERGWNSIGHYLSNKKGVRNFYTNDNATVAKYYLYKYDPTPPGSNFYPQYYIYVYGNQEFAYPTASFLSSYEEETKIYSHNVHTATIYKLKKML